LIPPLRRWEWLALAAGLAARAALGLWSIRAQSPTFDEPPHLTNGVVYWRTGDMRLSATWHPPLAALAAGALPALAGPPLPPHPDRGDGLWRDPGAHFTLARDFLAGDPLPSERMVGWARVSMLALTSLLPVAVFLAARAAGGPAAGMIAFTAAALSPAATGHGALATADGAFALFFFLAFASLQAWEAARKPGWAAVAGAAMGAALCAKASAAPFVPLPLLWIAARARREAWRPALGWMASAAAVVLLVYRGQAGLLVDLMGFTRELVSQGRRSFLAGELFQEGVWHYFPAAFLLKTPGAVLAGALAAGAAFWRGRARAPMLLWAPGALFFLLACASPVQIGLRHILPAYPFLYVCLGLGLAPWLGRRAGRLFVGGLGAWSAAAALVAAPYPLAYFNEAAGGPDRGYKWLGDSNVDWGQGLKALKKFLDREGVGAFYFSYFGSVDPSGYGLRYLDVASVAPGREDLAADPRGEKRAFLVVSATNLQGTYYPDPSFFAWLRPYAPDAVVARSLLVYDVTDSPAVHRWLAEVFRQTGREGPAGREARWAEALGG
jgi:hypothetical protein